MTRVAKAVAAFVLLAAAYVALVALKWGDPFVFDRAVPAAWTEYVPLLGPLGPGGTSYDPATKTTDRNTKFLGVETYCK